MKHRSRFSAALLAAIPCAPALSATSRLRRIDKLKRFGLPARCARTLAAACGVLVTLSALPAHARCLPPPAGLVAWWPGDGNATDIKGGYNGTLGAGVTYGKGKVDRAFDFSGGDKGEVDLPAGGPSSSGQDFTIDAWVFPTAFIGNWDYVTIYADNFQGLWLKTVDQNKKSGRIEWWRRGERFVGKKDVVLNAWTHIALTYSSADGVFTSYVNGGFDSASSNNPGPGEFPPYLGMVLPIGPGLGIGGHLGDASQPGSEEFFGRIDEVEIFGRALSPSEIQAIHGAGRDGKCKPQARGVTWVKRSTNPVNGTIFVGCVNCDPYAGDTPCSRKLPLLCFRPLDGPGLMPKAPQPTSTVVPEPAYYYAWSGGLVGTTPPYRGDSFNTLQDADAACVTEFKDSRWRVAEMHDNGVGAWNLQAYGNVGTSARRFWVDINDQPGGTCWKRPGSGPSCQGSYTACQSNNPG